MRRSRGPALCACCCYPTPGGGRDGLAARFLLLSDEPVTPGRLIPRSGQILSSKFPFVPPESSISCAAPRREGGRGPWRVRGPRGRAPGRGGSAGPRAGRAARGGRGGGRRGGVR